ncbi:MAG: hypothetical protein ACFFAJ_11920 [Candidatus Hodarchaeota archaeon]
MTSITDHYESFLLISLYLLILFKLLADEDVKGDLKSFQKGKKLSAYKIYLNPQKEAIEPKLLRTYISESSLLVTHKQTKEILTIAADIITLNGANREPQDNGSPINAFLSIFGLLHWVNKGN